MPDLDSLNRTDATGKKPLDVVCQDWSTLASGTTTETLGETSMVDCPKDGCLGFAFTLGSDPTKKYDDIGAALSRCFLESAWKNNALEPRMDGDMLADPLCGEPRMSMMSDFCTDSAMAFSE